jgi:catechol-2,3-dioxygenase|tara:strand:- start:5839 stop:6177 length:339 start_codon:yes stop_codon:yes gene_type:complete
MNKKKLDKIHHIAIKVDNISDAIKYYTENFEIEIIYQDKTWSFLQFGNVKLALVLPGKHPPHLAFLRDDAEKYGELKSHRDGTSSIYVKDPFGNYLEYLKDPNESEEEFNNK